MYELYMSSVFWFCQNQLLFCKLWDIICLQINWGHKYSKFIDKQQFVSKKNMKRYIWDIFVKFKYTFIAIVKEGDSKLESKNYW